MDELEQYLYPDMIAPPPPKKNKITLTKSAKNIINLKYVNNLKYNK